MEAIFSAAEMGFTGSLVGSSIPCEGEGRLAAYMGTITGLAQSRARVMYHDGKLTMFLVSMPREQSRVLLLCEPPHWCRRPKALWMSCSCCHTFHDPLWTSQKASIITESKHHRKQASQKASITESKHSAVCQPGRITADHNLNTHQQ
uniref:Uncharacterized protein n=1 Tax=Paramormyrops kingsleyae TaxID=1676925 RepID=A0A3B3RPB3_9TELE